MRKSILLFIVFCITTSAAFAQADSLMSMLNEGAPHKQEPVTATFKATRIIDGSSVENLGMGILDFRIDHRFGQLNEGAQNFFGVDDATTKIAFDYGITNWLMVGIAHDVLNKEDNGFVKIKLLRQKIDGFPVTISYVGSMSIQTTPIPTSLPAGDTWHFSNRLYYTNQILIARKFGERLSLQIMPSVVHYNLVDSTKFSNNTFAIGVGGRVKLSKRIAVTGEYYYRLNNANMLYEGQATYNSLSFGIDIETGGHVFQLMLTNSPGMTERSFIGQTTGSWSKGDIHFGFNISRVFTVVKPKEFRDSGKTW